MFDREVGIASRKGIAFLFYTVTVQGKKQCKHDVDMVLLTL